MVRSGDIPVHLETMDPGVMYCVKAQALVKTIGRHSAFSQPTCVEMQGRDGLLVPGSLHLAALPVPGCPSGVSGSESFPSFTRLLPGLVSSKVNSDSPRGRSPPWLGFLEHCLELPPKPPPPVTHCYKTTLPEGCCLWANMAIGELDLGRTYHTVL